MNDSKRISRPLVRLYYLPTVHPSDQLTIPQPIGIIQHLPQNTKLSCHSNTMLIFFFLENTLIMSYLHKLDKFKYHVHQNAVIINNFLTVFVFICDTTS